MTLIRLPTHSWLGVVIATNLSSACGRIAPETERGNQPDAASESVGPHAAPKVEAAPSATGSRWRGSYSSAAGTLHLPAQWKSVRWTGADVDAGLGAGTMSLTVDTSTGRVRGAIEGPLGPATIDGYAAGGNVTATISRKDPSDRGFAGTLAGTLTDAGVGGTMNGSLAGASAIRSATFSLAQGGGATAATP